MCEEDASGSRSSKKGCRDLLDACSLGHEAGDTEILQVWHPRVQPENRDVCGWEERTGKHKQRGCPEWMGGTSALHTSFLSQGDTSAFSPSDLPQRRQKLQ